MYSRNSKNVWALFLLILAGIVLGGFIGHYASALPNMSWLDYGQTFGLTKPMIVEMGILSLTLGFTIKINISSVIGVAIGVIAYRRV